MATNLRLTPVLEAALRRRAHSSGCSQQEIIREALSQYLNITHHETPTALEQAVAAGLVMPPQTDFEDVQPWIRLAPGISSQDLIDRDDR